MWPAWYYLRGIRATDKFGINARAGRNVETRWFAMNPQERAMNIEEFWLKKQFGFNELKLKSLRQRRVWKDFDTCARGGRAHVARIVLFDSAFFHTSTYSSMLTGQMLFLYT